MKWITTHEYVVPETGEILKTLPDGYYIAKQIEVRTKTQHYAGKYAPRGTKTIVHAIRKLEYKQQQLFN